PRDRHVRGLEEVRMGLSRNKRQPGEGLETDEEIFLTEEQLAGRQDGALPIALEELIAAVRVGGESLYGLIDVPQRHGDGLFRQVVEQRGRAFEEQWQIIFDAREGNAVADVLVGQCARGVAFEDLPEPGAELVA